MSSEEVTLIGTLEKILYSNPENGFIIGTFLTENTIRPVTVKGIVYNNVVHETLNLKMYIWKVLLLMKRVCF